MFVASCRILQLNKNVLNNNYSQIFMKNEKFSKQDRDLVIKTLETMQGTTFLAIKPSQKFFVDKKQNYYCIFCFWVYCQQTSVASCSTTMKQ